ncbi:MAG: S-layer homology domain-containing protein [Clostridia bacterium]|nr:S-layer homology domain-containing protein [Clostridia bacterium]
MKKLLSLLLVGIMMLSSISVFAEDISSGVFGTEYLEGAKELEFTWDITESSYWELYIYNHSEESLKIELNKGTRNIYKKEVSSKQTAEIYAEEKFDKGTYSIKVVSLGAENLCGKLSYQITNNKDNLQRKIPESLKDMSGMAGASSNTPIVVFRPTESGNVKLVTDAGKVQPDRIIELKPAPATAAVNELFTYGIMKGDLDGNPRPTDEITRAEAVALLVRTNANYNEFLKDYLYRPTFDDIESHWAAREISFAFDNGLVEGTSETTFEPERKVTIQEFAKMLVTLLGYKERAEQQGGFPHGYIMTASSLGLMDNLNSETTKNALRKEVALMIVNSLDVPLMKQSGFGANTEYIVMDGKNGVALETFRTILETK